jgi:hypothetical protein
MEAKAMCLSNMLFLRKITVVLLILLTSLPNAACTKEKAEALKGAAELFRDEAVLAFGASGELIKQSIALPIDSTEDELKRIVKDFNRQERRDVTQLTQFVSEVLQTGSEGDSINQGIETEIRKLMDEYELFARMFQSLPRGNFLAKDIVPKAQKHAIRLTARLIKTANTLQKNPTEFRARRVRVIEKLAAAQEMTDQTTRNEAILLAGREAIQLREDEMKAKAAAVAQCLKAAEAGRVVTELIQGYQSMSIEDILNLTRNSLALLNAVTGGESIAIKGMQTRLEAFVKNKINNDPLWKDVLKEDADLLSLFGT